MILPILSCGVLILGIIFLIFGVKSCCGIKIALVSILLSRLIGVGIFFYVLYVSKSIEAPNSVELIKFLAEVRSFPDVVTYIILLTLMVWLLVRKHISFHKAD